MSLEKDIKELEEIQAKIRYLRQDATTKEKEIAYRYSGITPGDVVECNRYTHKGKKISVDTIKLFDCFGEWHVIATGNIIKKDGSFSRLRGEHKKVIYEHPKT